MRYRFPTIIQVCQHWNIDLFTTPIPVSPAAHYWMGGVLTDLQGQTSLPGLYAVGETASTGVHGANRLASNSLLECLVFGRRLGHLERTPLGMWPEVSPTASSKAPATPKTIELITLDPAELDWLKTLRQTLPQLIWKSAGICRTATVMDEALHQVTQWNNDWQTLNLSQQIHRYSTPGETIALGIQVDNSPLSLEQSTEILRSWLELGNLLEIAGLILRCALFREESRGGHYRLDFAEPQDQWLAHTLVQGDRLTKQQQNKDYCDQ